MDGRRQHCSTAAALLALTFFAVSTAGCSVRQYVGGVFGNASPTPAPAAEGQPTAYYAGVDGLKVYAEPRFSSPVVVVLKRHQKVYRYAVEHGFARVTVDDSGREGWVDNAQLIWRLPAPDAVGGGVETEPPAEQPVELQQTAPPPRADEAQPPSPEVPVDSPPQAQPAAAGDAGAPQPAPSDTPAVNPAVFEPF